MTCLICRNTRHVTVEAYIIDDHYGIPIPFSRTHLPPPTAQYKIKRLYIWSGLIMIDSL